MTTLPDLLYVALFAIVGPLTGYSVYWPAFRRLSQADPAWAGRWLWKSTIGEQWMLVAFGAAIWMASGRSWTSFGFTVLDGWRLWTAIALVLLLAAYYASAVRSITCNSEVMASARRQVGPLSAMMPHTPTELCWFGGVSLTAGFCEEFLYRGYFIWVFAPWLGWWGAAALSLASFAVAHILPGTKWRPPHGNRGRDFHAGRGDLRLPLAGDRAPCPDRFLQWIHGVAGATRGVDRGRCGGSGTAIGNPISVGSQIESGSGRTRRCPRPGGHVEFLEFRLSAPARRVSFVIRPLWKGVMRILAASDIHGRHDVYNWLASLANAMPVEALLLAGDLLGIPDGFETVEAAQQSDADSIARILKAVSVPVYYIMGNDDFVELTAASRQVRSLNLQRVDVGSYNFVGYQYTLPFMGGVFERSEEAIARDLESLAHVMDDRTVLVTHGPALGILDSTLLGPAGSASLRDTIEKRGVRAHIHGHIHSCFGRSGLHFNVAAAQRHRAMVIDLETMLHEVVGDVA